MQLGQLGHRLLALHLFELEGAALGRAGVAELGLGVFQLELGALERQLLLRRLAGRHQAGRQLRRDEGAVALGELALLGQLELDQLGGGPAGAAFELVGGGRRPGLELADARGSWLPSNSAILSPAARRRPSSTRKRTFVG